MTVRNTRNPFKRACFPLGFSKATWQDDIYDRKSANAVYTCAKAYRHVLLRPRPNNNCRACSVPDFMFCLCALPADAFLSDHPQNVIGQDCQFQYQLIGLKFAGWQPLHIHIGLDLAMELLVYDTLV